MNSSIKDIFRSMFFRSGYGTVPEMANLLNISPSGVWANIKRGIFTQVKKVASPGVGRGGKVWQIHINDPALPDKIKLEYNRFVVDLENLNVPVPRVDGSKALVPSPRSSTPTYLRRDRGQHTNCPALAISTSGIPEKAKNIALARLDLLRHWQQYREKKDTPSLFGKSKKTDLDVEFLQGHNSGYLYPSIFSILGEVQIRTLYNWKESFGNSGDWKRLIPQYYKTDGYPQLTQEEATTFMKFLLYPNKIRIGTAVRLTIAALQNKGIQTDKSPITFRRFAEKFKKEHLDRWVLMREGQKALKDKVEPYIKRDTSVISVGDVFIADGHRLNFQVINPHTGKPCRAVLVGYLDWKSYDLAGYEVMVEENTQCIASALRNSIIRLGRIPKITYQDNGKAFRAKFFTGIESLKDSGIYGLFARLGIIPVFAQPYNARSKVIERWFKEFSDTFERLLPSFIGGSISDRPAWARRNEKFHRALHKERVLSIEEVVQMIEKWLVFYRSQPCPHVKGKTIGEVFNDARYTMQDTKINIQELDDLMLAMKKTTITRNGIRFMNADYFNENLYGLNDAVIIKYSLFDISQIKVYTTRGEFLCTAERVMPVHPMAFQLGTVKDAEEVKQKISQIKRLEKRTVQGAKELINNFGKQPDIDWQKVIEASPNIVKKLEHADIPLPPVEKHIPEECVTPPRGEEGLSVTQPHTKPFFHEMYERYEYLMKTGINTKEDRRWVEEYKKTGEYRLIYEELRQDREV